MSFLYCTRSTRLLIFTSLTFAGTLTGCSSDNSSGTVAAVLSHPRLDTDWRTSSTYASATQSQPPHSALRTARIHACSAACGMHVASGQAHVARHRTM